MNSGNIHKAENEVQREDSELPPPPEVDDEEEDEFIEVSILDGLSIDELPPPTTLFREEDGKLIEVSIFGRISEGDLSPPTNRTRDGELHEEREGTSVSVPVVPNPPPIDSQEDKHQSPSFSIKKEEEEEVQVKREAEEDEKPQGDDDFEAPLLNLLSLKTEEEEDSPTRIKNIPPPTNRDDDSDSEYTPPTPLIKEEDSKSDVEESKKSKKRRNTTRRKRKKKRKKYSPRWSSSQFPSEKDDEGDYYCADCERGNDIIHCRICKRQCWYWCNGEECEEEGYHHNKHEFFKSLPRKKRRWNSDLFPSEKTSSVDYYCADCERGNDIQKCRNCRRVCWRWCDGEECKEEEGYKDSARHKCFKSKKKRKQRPRWESSDFPQKKEGEYYCGDCKSSNERTRCSECGRQCWKWCQKCGEYRNIKHICGNTKKKRKRKRKRIEKKEEKEEFEKLEPAKKRRKLE